MFVHVPIDLRECIRVFLFQTFWEPYPSLTQFGCEKKYKKCTFTFRYYTQFDKSSTSFRVDFSVFSTHFDTTNLFTFALSLRFRIIQLLCGTSTILEQQVGKRANLLVKWLVSMKLASSSALYFIVDYIKWSNKRAGTWYLGGWAPSNLPLSTI